MKAALHVSNTAAVDLPLCREREVEQLQPAVWQAMLSSQGGFCYIAGTPGIGATLIQEQIACTYGQPFTCVLDRPALRRLTHAQNKTAAASIASAVSAFARHPCIWTATSIARLCMSAGKTMTVRAVVLREFARLAKDRQAAHVTLPGLISVNCMSTDGGSVMGRLVAGMEHVNRRSAAQVS